MKPIPESALPKRHYTLAAECRVDFEDILDRLNGDVKRRTFRDGLPFPKRYRYVCLQLSTGRFATLTQTELDTSTVEIGLEIKKHQFFHETDLLEILNALEISEKRVQRMQGDFVWIPAESKPKSKTAQSRSRKARS